MRSRAALATLVMGTAIAVTVSAAACTPAQRQAGKRLSSSAVMSPSSVPTTSTTPTTAAVPSTTLGSGDAKADVNGPGDIPDNQVFVQFSPAQGGFTIKVPEGWGRTEQGGAATFTDKYNAVSVATVPAAAAPTPDSVRQSEVPKLAASTAGFVLGNVQAVHKPAGDVVLTTYKADSGPNSVTGKAIHDAVERYDYWRNGTEVVVTLSGPDGADNVDPWRTITESFTWS